MRLGYSRIVESDNGMSKGKGKKNRKWIAGGQSKGSRNWKRIVKLGTENGKLRERVNYLDNQKEAEKTTEKTRMNKYKRTYLWPKQCAFFDFCIT